MISSNAVNTDLSDIATALTGSLAADGQTPLTGAMKGVNGSLGAPSWSFNNDPASGVYLPAVSQLGLVAGGNGVLVDALGSAASGAPTVSAAGSGYVVSDQITLTGGTFTNPVVVQVATLSGSGVATVTLVEAGRYTAIPSNPAAQGSTTGVGTGATFTVSWSSVLSLSTFTGAQLWAALGATSFARSQLLLANSTAAILGAQGVTAYNLAASTISPNVTMVNGTLVQSQAGGAQTFAIKTLAGTDATSTNPIYFVFRDVTAGTGDFTVRSVTAALSVTIPAGGGTNTMGFTSSTPARIWIGALDNGGTVELFVLNALTATATSTISYSLQGWGIISTSAISSATAAQTPYSTAARSSKPYVVLGYASWEAPATMVAGAWNVAPTRLNLYQPGVTPLPGQEIQRGRSYSGTVATGTTTVGAFGTNNPWTQSGTIMGDQYFSLTMTPTSSANLLEIETQLDIQSGTGSGRLGIALFQDSTVNAISTSQCSLGASALLPLRLTHEMLAATLSSTTFKVRAGGNVAGTNTLNGVGSAPELAGTMNSWLRVREIQG